MWGQKTTNAKRGEISPTFFRRFRCTSYLIIKSPNKTKKKGKVHINNTINNLGFEENMFEEFQIEEDVKEITSHVKLKRLMLLKTYFSFFIFNCFYILFL